ncbi:nucleotidyltransferase domain-containing protein [Methanosarcina sp.]|uniref:nucleotidyltransferase domain-containing protein n=1 Tax=Methanosarcina sp. TaxID=2213 RepID=UPI003C77C32E
MGEFSKCVGNKILGWFLSHPASSININELARELEVSPGSVNRFTDLFYREHLVDMKKIGTAHMFTLKDSSYVVKELKKTFMVLKLWKGKLEELAPNAISLAVYGSTASGCFDEKSDIDILVIGAEQDVNYTFVPEIETEVGHELQVTVIPYYEWESRKENGDPFVLGVLARYILFAGEEL